MYLILFALIFTLPILLGFIFAKFLGLHDTSCENEKFPQSDKHHQKLLDLKSFFKHILKIVIF